MLVVLADSCGSQTVILMGFQEIHKTLSEQFWYYSILQWSNILSLWETVIYYNGVIHLTGTATRKLYLLTPLVRGKNPKMLLKMQQNDLKRMQQSCSIWSYSKKTCSAVSRSGQRTSWQNLQNCRSFWTFKKIQFWKEACCHTFNKYTKMVVQHG